MVKMGKETSRIKTPILAIILVAATVLLSIIMIYQAMATYMAGGDGSYFLTLGITMLAVSTYMLLQWRRRTLKLSSETPQVITTIQCQKCEFKSVRKFERGDYLFKEMEPCPKCKGKMIITSIYREVKESK